MLTKRNCKRLFSLLVLVLLVFVSFHSRGDEGKRVRFTLEEIRFYPPSLKESLGKSLETMLFTRLARRLSPTEGKEVVKVFLSVTRIGSAFSLDGKAETSDGRLFPFSYTVPGESELPSALEKLAEDVSTFALGESVSPKRVETRRKKEKRGGEEKKEASRYLKKISRRLPLGRFVFVPGGRGAYEKMCAGDTDRDGKDEVIGAGFGKVEVWKTSDEGNEKIFDDSYPEGWRVKNVACADLDRDTREEVLVALSKDGEGKWLLYEREGEDEKFARREGDGFQVVSFEPGKGIRLVRISGRGEPPRAVQAKFSKEALSPLDISGGPDLAGILWMGGKPHPVSLSEGSIVIEGVARIEKREGRSPVSLEAVDIDGDGNQELVVLEELQRKGNFFESLSVPDGFIISVYGFFRGKPVLLKEYRREGGKPAGMRILRNGTRFEFTVYLLRGSIFALGSMTWEGVTVR